LGYVAKTDAPDDGATTRLSGRTWVWKRKMTMAFGVREKKGASRRGT
jgi:hypothetical protein